MMLGALLGRGAADAHDARGWLEMQLMLMMLGLASGLLERRAAHDARGWLRDCRKMVWLMLLGVGFGTAGKWGC